MRKVLEIGGLVAAVVLVAFGVVAIAMGVNGAEHRERTLQQEQIVGTPDMTPAAITAEAQAGRAAVADSACRRRPSPEGDHERLAGPRFADTCGSTRLRRPAA